MASEESAEPGTPKEVIAYVDSGICGFTCIVKARKGQGRNVDLSIQGSDCGQIQRLAANLRGLTLRELFMPLTRNPVYLAAEKAGCHPSCPVPVAIVKAAEAAMDMALPKSVTIRIET